MQEQTPLPAFMAAASLSPVSPKPVYATVSQMLPELQQQAENPNTVPYEPTILRTASAAMEMTQQEPLASNEASASNADVGAEGDESPESSEAGQDHEEDPHPYSRDYEAFLEATEERDDDEEKDEDDAEDDTSSHETAESNAAPAGADDLAEAQSTSADVTMADESMPVVAAPTITVPISAQAAIPTLPVETNLTEQPQAATAPTATVESIVSTDPSNTSAAPTSLTAIAPATEEASIPQPAATDAVMPDAAQSSSDANGEGDAIDLQKLVDQIAAQSEQPASQIATTIPSAVIPQAAQSSLPPKPTLTAGQAQVPFPSGVANLPNFPPPGTLGTAPNGLLPLGLPGFPAPPAMQNGSRPNQTYDDFVAEERKHMTEARWDRFPDGSRIFIGNLSQERVSKRDVFEVFHVFGPMAQISLKSAYGFVQYHATADAQAAMDSLQGSEIKGRKINLEISRTQKRGGREREQSPDRRGGRDRGGRAGDRLDRFDGRDHGRQGRDDYRPGRSPSPPRRNGDGYGRRGNDLYGRDRKRSQSPERFGRGGGESYRRRSPSPRGRQQQQQQQQQQQNGGDELDIPRRFGADVPDVQILLLQEVAREFVDWVQKAFWDQGLKVNIMFLHPRMPREAVIRRQVVEGVHGVIELDARTQALSKIPLQVFDRSAGNNNARFDQYQDLDPPIAAQLVLRTKNTPPTVLAAPAYQPPVYPPQQQAYQAPPPPQYPPQYAPPQQQQQQQQVVPPPAVAAALPPDLSSLVGRLDNNTLQTLLASLQNGQAPPVVMPQQHQQQQQHTAAAAAPPPANPQLDALLRSLGAAGTPAPNATPQGPPQQQQQAPPPQQQQQQQQLPGYGIVPNGYGVPPQQQQQQHHHHQLQQQGGMVGGGDPAAQVQNIMATLAKFRQ